MTTNLSLQKWCLGCSNSSCKKFRGSVGICQSSLLLSAHIWVLLCSPQAPLSTEITLFLNKRNQTNQLNETHKQKPNHKILEMCQHFSVNSQYRCGPGCCFSTARNWMYPLVPFVSSHKTSPTSCIMSQALHHPWMPSEKVLSSFFISAASLCRSPGCAATHPQPGMALWDS